MLLVGAVGVATDGEMSVREKVAVEVAVVGVAALAYAIALTALVRAAPNRALLIGAAAFALMVAFWVGLVTLGIGFPVSAVLLLVAIGDLDRAFTLSGFRGTRRVVAFIAALAVIAAFAGLALPVVLAVAAAAVAVGAWKLLFRGRRPATPT